jgi:hypothetical protein
MMIHVLFVGKTSLLLISVNVNFSNPVIFVTQLFFHVRRLSEIDELHSSYSKLLLISVQSLTSNSYDHHKKSETVLSMIFFRNI